MVASLMRSATPQSRRRFPVWPITLIVLLSCGPTSPESSSSTSTGTESSSSTSTGTEAPTTSESSSTNSNSATESTTIGADSTAAESAGAADLGVPTDCDLFAQDCPPGYKCAPMSVDGTGTWSGVGCVEVVEDPAARYEPCTSLGDPTSGMDTCDFGHMCWDIDPDTLEGTCYALCTGDESSPVCDDPLTDCRLTATDSAAVCLFVCNPLGDDCPRGDGCYPSSTDFFCATDASGPTGIPGDPCQYLNVCETGTMCVSPSAVPDCMDDVGCCTSFCNVTEGDGICLPGQICEPWYEPGAAPASYEDLGVCTLPL